MTDGTWIALATLVAMILIAVFGGIFNLLSKIGKRFVELGTKIDERTNEIRDSFISLLDNHERRDQDRHEETIQRLTRVETIAINGNGHGRKRK